MFKDFFALAINMREYKWMSLAEKSITGLNISEEFSLF